MKYLLEANQLTVKSKEKIILDNVSFKAGEGRITAIVGGSGSGKTTIANTILGLLPDSLEVISGEIIFEHKNLFLFSNEQMRLRRGAQIAMVYQEPLNAFNPLITVGRQIEEVLEIHSNLKPERRRQKVLEVLSKVELSSPLDIYNRYPHQLSGGQRQRAMLAQALVAGPKLMIADEPTSNLDVTLQARIMDLLRQFKKEGMTILLISHDLGMVTHLADEVVILEKGHVVEEGAVASIMKTPRHKYTKSLLEAFV